METKDYFKRELGSWHNQQRVLRYGLLAGADALVRLQRLGRDELATLQSRCAWYWRSRTWWSWTAGDIELVDSLLSFLDEELSLCLVHGGSIVTGEQPRRSSYSLMTLVLTALSGILPRQPEGVAGSIGRSTLPGGMREDPFVVPDSEKESPLSSREGEMTDCS
ncbi:hypothetical protein CLIM01_14198 [Colletotrichum limetticola]|uniref:Uncharacterized protein n=1 Tax=Colletotrichum limetticola TaxID=1209924 RepID=A0ABQ9PEV3_9PEZI|nr:hypothetical protein CLIM01_14198 [Colletotrichum limetticola]